MLSNSPSNPLGFAGSSTSTDAATTVLTIPAGSCFTNFVITTTGANAGYFSIDGGVSWHYFPGGSAASPGGVFFPNMTPISYPSGGTVKVMNAVSGSNLSGVRVSMA